MSINNNIQFFRFLKFGNIELPAIFNAIVTKESYGISNSDGIELSNELKQIGFDAFINKHVQKQRESILNEKLDATNNELNLFLDFYIDFLLCDLLQFLDDETLIQKIQDRITSTLNNRGLDYQLSKLDDVDDKLAKVTKAGEKLGLSGKQLDNYVRNSVALLNKEQKTKAEQDAKLLGTAMQQLLPEIFENKRAIPNSFLRGALFGMVRKGRRQLVKDEPVFTMSQYEVSFSGEHLDQNDLELWDTLMYLAKERKVDNELRITLYDLCQQMRLSSTKTAYDALIARTKRLKFGVVEIKIDTKKFGGSLINNYYIDTAGDGKLVIEYNKKLTPLFTDNDYTLVSADIRHLLGDNQLARWLYNFYESHNDPIPFSIDFLQKLCRSETELKDFKRKLKIALEHVKKAHLSVNIKSKWDYEITDGNYLLVYPNGKNKTKKQLDLFSKF